MEDRAKSKEQLIEELEEIRKRVADLETTEINVGESAQLFCNNEKLLQNVFDSIQEGIIVLDKDLNIIRMNRTIQERMPHVKQIEGKKCYRVFHERSEPCEGCASLRALELGTTQWVETTPFLFRDSLAGWYERHAHPLIDDNGEITGVIEYIRNNTYKKILEQKLSAGDVTYQELFNNMTSGVAVYEALEEGDDFIIKDVNKAAERIENIKKEDVIGKTVCEVFSGVRDFGLLEVLQRVLKTGKTEHFPIALYKDPRIQSWRENQVYKLASGEIVAIYNDVTEKKLAEEALQASEEKYRRLFHSANDAIFLHGFTEAGVPGHYLEVNEVACSRLGYSRDELLNMSPYDLVVDEDWPKITKNAPKAPIDTKLIVETVHVAKDGSQIPVEISANIFNMNGRKLSLSIARDIRERKQIEKVIREQREWFQVTLSSIGDGVIAIDTNGRLTFMNKVAEKLIGYSEAESVGRPVEEVFHIINEETRTAAEVPMNRVLREGIVMGLANHTILISKDGTEYPISDAAAPIRNYAGEIIGVVMVFQDMSERKKAEERVQQSEEKFRNIYSQSPFGIGLFDINGKLIDMNKASMDILGIMDCKEVLGSSLFEETYLCITSEVTKQLFLGYEVRFEAEFDFENVKQAGLYQTSRNGKSYLHCEFTPLKSQKGARYGYLMQIQDITKRKTVEKELQESEERYRRLIELSPDAIIVHSEGTIIIANPALSRLLRLSNPEEILGKTFLEIIERFMHPDYQQTGAIFGIGQGVFEGQLLCADGEAVFVEMASSSLTFHGKSAVQIVLRDVSERKRLEEEQLRSTKLEAIGILAGGIAHDFNNVLTAILGNASLAALYTESLHEEKVNRKLAEIIKGVERAQDLTQQLLTFAKGGAPVKTIGSIKGLVEETTNFALSGSNVRGHFSFDDHLWMVNIDEGQISQVINNLIINAVQAMPEGGNIRIKANNITVSEEHRFFPLKAGHYVKMSFQDEGLGIPQKHLPKIFDPYFTTKQKGSGLGLATSYSIAKNHEGHITVTSEVGVGTTFELYLPATFGNVVMADKINGKLFSGKGKILLMDDDEVIREVAGEMLSYLGFEITLAQDGVEAIELFTAARMSGYPFDVVIMDLTVPGGMGGKEAIQKLRAIDPEIRAIVSSGYSNNDALSNYTKFGFDDFVAKPYQVKELSEAVYRVMKAGKRIC